jgi:hypothetical protein
MATKTRDEALDRPVWGAEAIGRIIGKPARATYHLLEKGLIPAKKVGDSWVSSPRKLLAAIVGDE